MTGRAMPEAGLPLAESPSDKVPKRVETVRWKPIPESHGIKGEGPSNKVRIIENTVSAVNGRN